MSDFLSQAQADYFVNNQDKPRINHVIALVFVTIA